MERDLEPLSASALAELADVTAAEVERLVALGILAARDGAAPFRTSDAKKVRLAKACEQAGLPMEGIAAVIRQGRLSFAFLDASPYQRWALRSARTYRQVSQETGVPLELLRDALESMGFPPATPDDPIREDELEAVPLLRLAHTTGIIDRPWMTRVGRGYARACATSPGSRPRSTTRASRGRCWSPAPTRARPWSGPPTCPASSTPWSTAR
jgi:hypothetical protein